MPPLLALVLSLGAIWFLLAQERRMNPDVSPALWIPFLWLFFIGTRFPSQWLALGTATPWDRADALLEGSPIDQAVYLVLYAAALAVLVRRRIRWGDIIGANLWIAVFFIYGLVSVAWSDYPGSR